MKKYKSFTLLEVLIVMAIMLILMTVSVVVYRSLIYSFTINETSLTIAQDIRSTQRAAMLLDREGDERWLYGIGIDFTKMANEGKYEIFKWCSQYDFYDESKPGLTGELPGYPGTGVINTAHTQLSDYGPSHCRREPNQPNTRLIVETKSFDNLDFELKTAVSYILFESVSGKAFFYGADRGLLNYGLDSGEIILNGPVNPPVVRFILELTPERGGAPGGREINVLPVSGRVFFKF